MKKIFIISSLLFLMFNSTSVSYAQTAPLSYRLTNTVQSSGSTGSKPIEFHKESFLGATVTERMAAVEALRQDFIAKEGVSKLVFGVDVNEAASGTEKSETQAVTLKSVLLHVVMDDGTTYDLTDFSTLTQSLLAAKGEPASTRKPYYTLLGSTGSNTITGSVFKDKFDSTLSVMVPDTIDFSQAVEATLHIEFLTVNNTLGDPELFYDYSNGFEDLAILSDADARYLDNVAKGIISNGDKLSTEAPISAGAPMVINLRDKEFPYVDWIGYPASTGYYLVGYEDLYPDLGDYDFNDLTVAYRVEFGLDLNSEVTQIRGEAILVTRGASYNHDWHLRIHTPKANGVITESLYQPTEDGHGALVGDITSRNFNNADQIDLLGFKETRVIFPPAAGCSMTNTNCDTFVQGPKYIFNITFDRPVSLSNFAPAPFDPYLYVYDTNYEIHMIGKTLANQRTAMGYKATSNQANGKTTFVDNNGFPWAMMLVQPWSPMNEAWSMEIGYPDFTNYVESKGNDKKDWYLRPNQQRTISADKFTWWW